MPRILIIDDDRQMNEALSSVIERMGHAVVSKYTLEEGSQAARTGNFDVIFLDVMMPDGNGLEMLSMLRESASEPEIIVITGFGDSDDAELAIKNGAWDYIKKPATVEEMTLPLLRALQFRNERGKRMPYLLKRESIIGYSSRIKGALQHLAKAVESSANVLIVGETGTGKELFARAIHENSARASKRFVILDCAALPESLVENILFGHEKGAFTGADQAREGLIEQSDGGTLFLDEVGELPLSIQKAFLRVVQERKFRPIGDKNERKSDFRLIAATNRDLDLMTQKGQFRGDLLFRLRGITIELPPLRELPEDINSLVIYYTNRLCQIYSLEKKGFSPEFFEVMRNYYWPGNVRELINPTTTFINTH